MDTLPTIVVGGGLAGLTAAATLARDGRRVVVIEGASQLGGRARTRHHDGFDLNLGPHALYIGGGASAVLRDLGVGAPGRRPRLHRSGVLAGEQVVPAMRFLQREVRQRRRLMGLITGRGRGGADRLAGVTASEWIRDTLSDPGALAVATSLLRTATYSADRDLLDAGAAAMQLRAATTRGVRYIDGGWTTLVCGLAVQVRRHGGEIRTGVAAAAVEHDDQVHAVRLADGTTLPAAGVVVAVNDPRQALGLLDGPAGARLADAVDDMVPLRMAHLDVALRPLPAAAHPNILGIDRPVYLTVQSDVARVAPEGGAVIHVGRYLAPGEERRDHRPELEHVLDVAQPGWRDHVIDVRYVPRSLVSGDHARPATMGSRGRVAAGAPGVRGLAIAGDWVGPSGMLADAAMRSGQDAAAVVTAGTIATAREAVAA